MPDLIATSPLQTQAPLVLAGLRLAETDPGPITSIVPVRGQGPALSNRLETLGLPLPGPGRFVSYGTHRLVWTGRAQFFLFGTRPEGLAGLAALTDQSDGWAGLSLEGPGAEAVLARLVPLDLRATAFPPGAVARTGLNHMAAMILRTGTWQFEILVFRSMARTAWHELAEAMAMVAARTEQGA